MFTNMWIWIKGTVAFLELFLFLRIISKFEIVFTKKYELFFLKDLLGIDLSVTCSHADGLLGCFMVEASRLI